MGNSTTGQPGWVQPPIRPRYPVWSIALTRISFVALSPLRGEAPSADPGLSSRSRRRAARRLPGGRAGTGYAKADGDEADPDGHEAT